MLNKSYKALILYCCLLVKSVVAVSPPNITQLQCGCGLANERMSKLRNGALVHAHKYPWMVTVRADASFCGGSLITRRYVLTSASCLVNARRVLAGIAVHDQDRPGQMIQASKIKIHPKYNRKLGINDVGLIKLAKAVTISERVRTLCLPHDANYEQPEKHAIVAGWGWTDRNEVNSKSPFLKEINVDIIHTNESTIQARGINGTVCVGDFGSPLFTRYADGRYHVIGVISAGPSICLGPFFSPIISSFNQWIMSNVVDSDPCEKASYHLSVDTKHL